MKLDFVSSTELQKNPKQVMGKKPIQVLMTNNKVSGILLSAEVAEFLMDSDILQQIREELWEIQDKETADLITEYKLGKKSDSISLVDFRKKYGL